MSSRPSVRCLTSPAVWADNVALPFAGQETEALSTTEADLVADLHARDSGALHLLFTRYSRLVLAIAYRVLGDAAEAEEVLQDVFFYIHRKPQVFDPSKGTIKAWIIQVAFSRALDRRLYLARRDLHTGGDIASLEAKGEIDVEHQVEANLNRKHLEKAFTELTDRQRRTIEFFYFEGLDLREISEQLSEPLGRVRHHLYRGLERLRKNSLLHTLHRK